MSVWCSLQYIEETEELAMNGLKNNRHILDLIMEELLEKSRITGLVRYKTSFSYCILSVMLI